jgi:hypothetical protein
MRAALKVEAIREDLGASGDVIAQQVEEAMLGKRRKLEVDATDKRSAEAKRWLKQEMNFREQLHRLKESVTDSARQLDLSPENVLCVVQVGLSLAGQPPLEPIAFKDIAKKPADARVFKLGALRGAWAQAKEGIHHPHTQEARPVVFDQALAAGRDDVVLAHLNHRLVQMCLGLLRSEIWSEQRTGGLRRITARVVPARVLDKPAAIAHARLVILGADNAKLHEELVVAGGTLSDKGLTAMADDRVTEILHAATSEHAAGKFQKRVTELWPKYRQGLLDRLADRQARRTRELEKKLHERCDKEVADVSAILEELRQTIQRELAKDDAQLGLFDVEEKASWERNRGPMERRLAQIPGEIDRETKATRHRYSEQSARLFPVAVTFLVPDSIKEARQ